MNRLAVFLLIVCVYSTASAQTPGDTAVAQIRQLLTPGKHLVHYFRLGVGQQLTDEQNALLAKVQKALADKPTG